jgi:hypothetical protein
MMPIALVVSRAYFSLPNEFVNAIFARLVLVARLVSMVCVRDCNDAPVPNHVLLGQLVICPILLSTRAFVWLLANKIANVLQHRLLA